MPCSRTSACSRTISSCRPTASPLASAAVHVRAGAEDSLADLRWAGSQTGEVGGGGVILAQQAQQQVLGAAVVVASWRASAAAWANRTRSTRQVSHSSSRVDRGLQTPYPAAGSQPRGGDLGDGGALGARLAWDSSSEPAPGRLKGRPGWSNPVAEPAPADGLGVLVRIDAEQAVGSVPVDGDDARCRLPILVGHKLYSPEREGWGQCGRNRSVASMSSCRLPGSVAA